MNPAPSPALTSLPAAPADAAANAPPNAPPMGPLALHIERLVLEGLPLAPADQARFQAVLEAELARLLADRVLHQELRGGVALPGLRLDLGPLPAGFGPEPFARALARTLQRGIGA